MIPGMESCRNVIGAAICGDQSCNVIDMGVEEVCWGFEVAIGDV